MGQKKVTALAGPRSRTQITSSSTFSDKLFNTCLTKDFLPITKPPYATFIHLSFLYCGLHQFVRPGKRLTFYAIGAVLDPTNTTKTAA